MGRTLLLSFIVSAILLMGPAGFADIYKYRDDKGQVHYTNNLSDIPQKYLQNIIAEKEIQQTPVGESSTDDAPQKGKSPDGTAIEKRQADLEAERDALIKKRESLDKQRKVLEEQKAVHKTDAARELYNQKVVQLNSAYQALFAQEKALTQKIQDYNRDLKKSREEQQD